MFSLCLRGFPPGAPHIKTCMLGSPVSALGRGTGLDTELVGCPKLLGDGFKAFSSSLGFISLKYMSLNPLGEVTEQEKGHSYMLLHNTRHKGRLVIMGGQLPNSVRGCDCTSSLNLRIPRQM